jgi:hypothetical protein
MTEKRVELEMHFRITNNMLDLEGVFKYEQYSACIGTIVHDIKISELGIVMSIMSNNNVALANVSNEKFKELCKLKIELYPKREFIVKEQ